MPDPLDGLFSEESGTLASELFRGYISHSLLFYRQNARPSFARFVADGRLLRLGPGGETGRPAASTPSGPGWPRVLAALRGRDEAAALRALDAAVRAAPRRPAFLVLRGFLLSQRYWGSRRLSPASLEDFERALALEPDNLWARMGAGMALEMRRRFTRARGHFEAASRIAPRWAWPHVFRGVCLWYQSEHAAALDAFARAARLAPESELPLLFSARAKADLRDKTMTADLDRALKLAPDSGFALSWRGRAMFVLTRLPEALDDLRRSCKLLPDYDRGWSWLGVSLLERGKAAQAVPLLRKARALNPYYPTTLYPLADALMTVGRWAEGERVMKEAAAVDSAGVWVEHRISMSHPNPAALRSRASLDRLVAKKPKLAWARAWRGQTELLLQEYSAALRDLTAAIELDKRDPWARVWRGEALRRLGEWSAALYDFTAALRIDGKLSWALAGKADCLLGLEKKDAALRAVNRSLAMQDYCAPAHAIKGRILLALKREKEAGAAFQAALELHPQDVWIKKLLDGAKDEYPERSFELENLFRDAVSLGLDECARALGRGDASAALRACADARRRELRLFRLRGWLKLQNGDAAGAAEDASRALDATLDPTDAASLWLRARAKHVLETAS